jgi:DNA-binding LacI/PurR family transcriptional regulator
MTAPKKPNIYDVAKLAGVSHQTVSRALNGSGYIKPETKAKVEAATLELGYRPSQAARALAVSKNNMVGLLVADTGLYGPAGMLNSMEREARRAGYFALSVAIESDAPDTWSDGIEHLGRLGIEGLICIALNTEMLQLAVESLPGIPVIAVDTAAHPGVTVIGIDNKSGARLAVEHLIGLGHSAILHVAGPESSAESSDRRAGYLEAMSQSNLTPLIEQGDWSAATGLKIGSRFDFAGTGTTAVFAANDHLALGIQRALKLRGIRVPQQVSIVGFDDIPEAPYFETPLTTIRQDFNQLGEAAMGLLLSELEGVKRAGAAPVTPRLVVRDSTSRFNNN